ncbi:hypothetical protein HOLleu_33807 [Holothuria leucospilota]|uniref:Uncharacterized protein n=1 Tax=Holothuria leucospilota TaxID=206669 RepID=A0A9Q1BI72_HOLLE|nr:hypothetical protein HOLleu_33807 [Holothuria leucospilota]
MWTERNPISDENSESKRPIDEFQPIRGSVKLGILLQYGDLHVVDAERQEWPEFCSMHIVPWTKSELKTFTEDTWNIFTRCAIKWLKYKSKERGAGNETLKKHERRS